MCEGDRDRKRYVDVMVWERESKGSFSFSDISFFLILLLLQRYLISNLLLLCFFSFFRLQFFSAFFFFYIVFVFSLNSTIFVLGH